MGHDTGTSLHFSLAGVQLKFSVLRNKGGALTLTARGVGGNVIVKIPSREHSDLPMNEHAMMTWARAAGINAPETQVAPLGEVRKLAGKNFSATELAFVIPRFDRGPDGTRIHIEDMAQVYGLYPGEKYTGTKKQPTAYEEMGKLLFELGGAGDFEEFVRRLVFNAVIGNADAHYKNWSLIYPDGLTPRLSPAYDLVATHVYMGDEDKDMAVKLFNEKKWMKLHASSFDLLADHVGHPRAATRAVIDATLDRVVATAKDIRDRFPLRPGDWAFIARHWKRVPLLRGRALFG